MSIHPAGRPRNTFVIQVLRRAVKYAPDMFIRYNERLYADTDAEHGGQRAYGDALKAVKSALLRIFGHSFLLNINYLPHYSMAEVGDFQTNAPK